MIVHNKKQCSRQLQCEVSCSISDVMNSALFINSSWSSLSLTSHAVFWAGGGLAMGGVWLLGGPTGGRRGPIGGRGQGTFWSSCHILHYHMVLHPKGTSHNKYGGSRPPGTVSPEVPNRLFVTAPQSHHACWRIRDTNGRQRWRS